MDIRVEWFDGDKWVFDSQFSSLVLAVIYASEEAQRTAWGSHRVMLDGKVYATFKPMGEGE